MDVDGICTIIKVSDRSILSEEVGSIEFMSEMDRGKKLLDSGVTGDRQQCAENVPCVEVVDPVLRRVFAVIPGTIRVLKCNRVANNSERWKEISLITGVPVYTT